MWAPQLAALEGEYEVAAIDLPGHGPRADERFSFPRARAAVEAAVGEDGPALLIGLSLGGYVAVTLGAERPELTNGLILTGCSVDYSRSGDRLVAVTGEMFQRAWPKRMLRQAQRSTFKRKYASVPELAEAEHYARGYADALRAARKVHWHGKLAGYDRPVLVLNGSLDKPHVRDAGKLLEGVRDGRSEVIDGAGHLANLDRPDAYTDAVRAHARRCG
jgi:pimeloyl-ACP methyl ester carboxylesterase